MKGVCLVAEEGQELESKSPSSYVCSAVSLSCARDFIAHVHGMKKCDCILEKKLQSSELTRIFKVCINEFVGYGKKDTE